MKKMLSLCTLALMFTTSAMANEFIYTLNSDNGELVAEFKTEDELAAQNLEMQCHQRLQLGLERNEFTSASCQYAESQNVDKFQKVPGRAPARPARPPAPPHRPGKQPVPPKYPSPPSYPQPRPPYPYPNPGRPVPPPRPPVMVTEVCTALRVDRITGIYVSQTYRGIGTAYDSWSARNIACSHALNQCERDVKIHQMCIVR